MASNSANGELDAFFDHLVRTETRLYNAAAERLRAEHGLVTSQFEYLRYVRDHPGSRVAQIATAFAAGVGAISKGADRLVAQGWLERRPNPGDGRSSLLHLTAAGAELVDAAETTFQQCLEDLVTPVLSADEIATTTTALAALRDALEQARVGTPVG